MTTDTHRGFVRSALMQAEAAYKAGEVPVGAVVVYRNVVIGRGYNRVQENGDPTAHAELIAMSQALAASPRHRLEGSFLYCTLEPCPMCTFAAMLNRIDTIVYGASDPKFGGCGSVVNLPVQKGFNHHPAVIGGIMEEECGAILKKFFDSIR